MQVTIVGNGIISLMTACYLKTMTDGKADVTIVGPSSRVGSASVAAVAMLNSFAELEQNSLNSDIAKDKFVLSQMARTKWSSFFSNLTDTDEFDLPQIGLGTYVLNNCAADHLDDENFAAIVGYLNEYDEPYEDVDPKSIPNYAPSPRNRALKALLLPNEGWVDSIATLNFLQAYLKKNYDVKFIDAMVHSLKKNADQSKIDTIKLDDGTTLKSDFFVLSPGANLSSILKESSLNLDIPAVFYGNGVTLEVNYKQYSHCVRTPNRGLACGLYTAPTHNGNLLIGASNFIAPYGMSAGRLTSIYTLLKAAMEQIDTELYRAELIGVRVGWRPTSADTFPLLGETSVTNLIIASGTKRDGFHLSPIIGEYISSLCLGQPVNQELFSHFKPERKLIRTLGRDEAISLAVKHLISASYQHDYEPAKTRMNEMIEAKIQSDLEALHDSVGAKDWGIPPELIDMYKYQHIK